MNLDDYLPYTNDPLIASFLSKFGGYFFNHAVCDYIGYIDNNENEYELPNEKDIFLKMVSESLETGKNLFLDYPVDDDLPEGAVV